ncbi:MULTISPECIES: DUF5954 family protein [Streptomyces]|uniref:DUF5954 family protein n=1 Tax=Streptomyces TaxID=1883 RepID=UPI0006251E85|nr:MULTISPECIES: DUF5954 family protein [Streptomyces]QXE38571.1 hypothetical protein KQY30_34445 [Streptomyces sp. GMY02]
MSANSDDTADGVFDDAAARRLLELGQREEALRRAFPVDGPDTDRMSVAHYTGYSAMLHEDRGWRQLFPAVQAEEEARADLRDVLRLRAASAGELAPRFTRAAEAVARGEDQVIIGEDVYRVVRIEQTVIMTAHGPQTPRPHDREFPEVFDERPGPRGPGRPLED